MVVAVVAVSTTVNPLPSQVPSLALLFSPWLSPLRHPPRSLSLSLCIYIYMSLIVLLVIELGVKEKSVIQFALLV